MENAEGSMSFPKILASFVNPEKVMGSYIFKKLVEIGYIDN